MTTLNLPARLATMPTELTSDYPRWIAVAAAWEHAAQNSRPDVRFGSARNAQAEWRDSRERPAFTSTPSTAGRRWAQVLRSQDRAGKQKPPLVVPMGLLRSTGSAIGILIRYGVVQLHGGVFVMGAAKRLSAATVKGDDGSQVPVRLLCLIVTGQPPVPMTFSTIDKGGRA